MGMPAGFQEKLDCTEAKMASDIMPNARQNSIPGSNVALLVTLGIVSIDSSTSFFLFSL